MSPVNTKTLYYANGMKLINPLSAGSQYFMGKVFFLIISGLVFTGDINVQYSKHRHENNDIKT